MIAPIDSLKLLARLSHFPWYAGMEVEHSDSSEQRTEESKSHRIAQKLATWCRLTHLREVIEAAVRG